MAGSSLTTAGGAVVDVAVGVVVEVVVEVSVVVVVVLVVVLPGWPAAVAGTAGGIRQETRYTAAMSTPASAAPRDRSSRRPPGTPDTLTDRRAEVRCSCHPAPEPGPAGRSHGAFPPAGDEREIGETVREWALEDSNLRPQPCEGCALTN